MNKFQNFLLDAWDVVAKAYRAISVAGISIVMVILSGITLFAVDQVTDAIIALGDYGKLHHFIIFGFIGILWAFFIWYWARVFYNIEYSPRTDLEPYEKWIVTYIPRIFGALALLFIGLAFLRQAPYVTCVGGVNPIRIIGYLFVGFAAAFYLFVNWRCAIFNLKPYHGTISGDRKILPVGDLPNSTRNILLITTAIVIILLVGLIIAPIHLTVFLGDGVTVLIGCLCIWVPLLYWLRYFRLKLSYFLYIILVVIIGLFSCINSNKDVRLVQNITDTRVMLTEYYQNWYTKNKKPLSETDNRIPMVIVLSEGGGIRAAYWSAQFLARVQRDYPDFRNYLFSISGVSGGSFGATIFTSLLDYYDRHPEKAGTTGTKSVIQEDITAIAGKDYLSPVIAAMLTREPVQFLLPFPISSFDHAKVFENTWEMYWRERMNGDETFGQPLLSLWNDEKATQKSKNQEQLIPALFVNVTRVENGYPVTLSHLRFNYDIINKEVAGMGAATDYYLPRDFYNDILGDETSDVRISTASLLSARFPYVGPAGTVTGKDGDNAGLVDGGYFDNTGANTIYQVLFHLKKWNDQIGNGKIYEQEVKPVIVYLQNDTETPDQKSSGRSMFYQLIAPIETFIQLRDANTNNTVFKLKEYVEMYHGEFITYSLQKDEHYNAPIPLGWALSKKTQQEIDERVEKIDIGVLGRYLR